MQTTRNRDLASLLTLLADQKAASKDFVVNPRALEIQPCAGGFDIVLGKQLFAPSSWAASQVGAMAGIPKTYADTLAEHNPNLLAHCVKDGLSRVDGSKVLRTVGGRARALVSNRYFALDAFDLLRETLPVMFDGGFQVQQSELSERRLYVRAVSPRTTVDVKVGDPVQFGIALSTSDVGGGALKVEPFFHRLACLNGMVIEKSLTEGRKVAVRKNHVERGIDFEGDTFTEFLTNETREKKAAAIYSEARDMIVGLSNPDRFKKLVEAMQSAAARDIQNTDIETVVARAMAATAIVGKDLQGEIIKALVNGNQGAGFTQWGLANSFTAQAHTTEDSDKADALMRAGGRIITLTDSEWRKVAA